MEPAARRPQGLSTQGPLSRLRLAAYGAIITAVAFAQSPGLIVPDTKYDLVTTPGRFLVGGLHLWDAHGAFGQIQNQAYGYLWPMGPFFLIGKLAALPEWAVQRLWWALLLNLAFFGMLRLARDLRLGRPWTQLAAAVAFVLAPRVTSILGESSVELWPTALLPWVLIPLVRGSERGPLLRYAAVSALAIACCGGVNATAVSAVLPAGLIWLLTRARGPRRIRLLLLWAACTLAATLWWLIPLLLQGRYAAPFLDYIETAHVTQSVTGLADSLLGISDWTPYVGGATSYDAGTTILSTPFLLLDAAAIAALGLWGLARTDNPHRRFLIWTLLAGLALVGFGYVGDVHGWWAGSRNAALDAALSPLRNTHKYDGLIRLALCLGLAHGLAALGELPVVATAARLRRAIAAGVVIVLAGLAFPWVLGQVAAPGGLTEPAAYWQETATWLKTHSDSGTALIVPAATFGEYVWGTTNDDALQPYADSAWAVRNAVPLAQPGNVDLLDSVTAQLEAGRPSATLAAILRRAGVTELVVRNDLNRLVTGAPDPALVHAVLDTSPGLTRVAFFGPQLGEPAVSTAPDGSTVIADGGIAGRYPAVEVYAVAGASGDATLTPTGVTVAGDPGAAGVDGLVQGTPVLAGDASSGAGGSVILTDGLRRREMDFGAVRRNASATSPAGSPVLTYRTQPVERVFPDQERWETTETWRGIAGVEASTSQAQAGVALPPLVPADSPAAAMDEDPATAWHTANFTAIDGQWLQVDLGADRAIGSVTITVPSDATPVANVVITAGSWSRTMPAPAPGRTATYAVGATASTLRVTAQGAAGDGWWGISSLAVPGLHPLRVLALPAPPAGAAVEQVLLHRDLGRTTCPTIGDAVTCSSTLGEPGEDGDELARSVDVGTGGAFDVAATASVRDADALQRLLGVEITGTDSAATGPADPADSPLAMIDGDPSTTWRSSSLTPTVRLRLPSVRRLHSLTLRVTPGAAASSPASVRIVAGRHQADRRVPDDGVIRLPGWRARTVSITVLSARGAYASGGGTVSLLPVGVSELDVDGAPVLPATVETACGTGPDLRLGDTRLRTALGGALASLVRGASVPLRVCDPVPELSGSLLVDAQPTAAIRVDTLTLTVPGARPVVSASVAVTRDGRGDPVAAALPARTSTEVLALPQNANPGWVATLDGVRLPTQRVDGWQQGWLVPAGAAGSVTFSYPPDRTYRWGLLVGAVSLACLVVVAVAARRRPVRRRADLPPLEAGGAGIIDGAVVVVALGWLGGTVAAVTGLVALAALALVGRARCVGPLAVLSAALLLLAGLLRAETGADVLAQTCALGAVGAASAAVAGGVRPSLRRRKGDSNQR